jgi:hypothetical protein
VDKAWEYVAFENEAVMKTEVKRIGEELTLADVEAITRIAREHAALVRKLKEALIAGDILGALRLARQVCGLPDEVTH